jgi:hypothetical protein
MFMVEQRPKPGKPPEDDWGTSTRMGYEDRPAHQTRKLPPKRNGSRFLRTIGSVLVVGGLAWITYVATSPNGLSTLLRPGLPSPPVLVLAGGLLILLLEKLVR